MADDHLPPGIRQAKLIISENESSVLFYRFFRFLVLLPYKTAHNTFWTPAEVIKREELGSLLVGSDADIAILNIRQGKFGLFDYTGRKLQTARKLECEMTVRAGRIVYDLNGRANPIVRPVPPRVGTVNSH